VPPSIRKVENISYHNIVFKRFQVGQTPGLRKPLAALPVADTDLFESVYTDFIPENEIAPLLLSCPRSILQYAGREKLFGCYKPDEVAVISR
jgi:hypothetical protein